MYASMGHNVNTVRLGNKFDQKSYNMVLPSIKDQRQRTERFKNQGNKTLKTLPKISTVIKGESNYYQKVRNERIVF